VHHFLTRGQCVINRCLATAIDRRRRQMTILGRPEFSVKMENPQIQKLHNKEEERKSCLSSADVNGLRTGNQNTSQIPTTVK